MSGQDFIVARGHDSGPALVPLADWHKAMQRVEQLEQLLAAAGALKTIVHVNQHVIRANNKTGARDPVLTVKTYKTNDYAHEVDIDGPCRIIYSPDKPLPCGARVWIETHAPVRTTLHGPAPQAPQG